MRISSSSQRRSLNGKTPVATADREPVLPGGRVEPAEAIPDAMGLIAVEIAAFSAHLRETPEIRINLVNEAKRRVSSGYYLTREAVLRTSAEILEW
jgi:hypothetical protein